MAARPAIVRRAWRIAKRRPVAGALALFGVLVLCLLQYLLSGLIQDAVISALKNRADRWIEAHPDWLTRTVAAAMNWYSANQALFWATAIVLVPLLYCAALLTVAAVQERRAIVLRAERAKRRAVPAKEHVAITAVPPAARTTDSAMESALARIHQGVQTTPPRLPRRDPITDPYRLASMSVLAPGAVVRHADERIQLIALQAAAQSLEEQQRSAALIVELPSFTPPPANISTLAKLYEQGWNLLRGLDAIRNFDIGSEASHFRQEMRTWRAELLQQASLASRTLVDALEGAPAIDRGQHVREEQMAGDFPFHGDRFEVECAIRGMCSRSGTGSRLSKSSACAMTLSVQQ